MKLPDAIQSFLGSKADKEPAYLSIYLDVHTVAVSVWQMAASGKAHVIASAHLAVKSDTWKDRMEAVDRLLGALEQKTGRTDVTTAILGIPAIYLTATGEIKKEIRSEIKNLAKTLELTLAGFVPLHQSIIFKLKTDEGVPPSVILLGVNSKTIAISLYKIGSLVGLRDLEKHDDVSLRVEEGLKSFTEMEVLPARMLLYGSENKELEEMREKLLHHQCTTRANFLHFPKIEIVTIDMIIDSISLAGASEMRKEAIGEDEKSEPTQTQPPPTPEEDRQQAVFEAREDSEDEEAQIEEESEEEEQVSEEEMIVEGEVKEAARTLEEDFAVDEKGKEDANVVVVDAESLGFKKDADVLEEKEQISHGVVKSDVVRPSAMAQNMATLGKRFGLIGSVIAGGIRNGIASPKQKYLLGILVLCVLGFVWGSITWVLPQAVVTIYEIPQSIEAAQAIVIDPSASSVDAEESVVPGVKRERTMEGEKTVAVKGKKNVGDPARGTVVIYNKSLSSKTFSKGTVLQSGSLKFSLDSDVQVASASESIGSITFGKQSAAVTAVAIGAAGNLPSGSEFTFVDVSSSIATARNDTAFTGGTSREVTVVSRADVDALVEEVSDELTSKAQQELSQSVEGGESLIDGTIKTTVTQKTFDQEIDQEAGQLHGKVTVTVSGTAFRKQEVRSLFEKKGRLTAPTGYRLDSDNTSITLSNMKVQKDGKITAQATIKSIALPMLDTAGLPKALAGKSLSEAEAYLRTLSGVGGMEVSFRLSASKKRLPFNKNNISVSLAIAQ